MVEFKSEYLFKTDKPSVDEALAHLVELCKKIKREDFEAIGDAIHFSAMNFDVDESVLNEAWGSLSPKIFSN